MFAHLKKGVFNFKKLFAPKHISHTGDDICVLMASSIVLTLTIFRVFNALSKIYNPLPDLLGF